MASDSTMALRALELIDAEREALEASIDVPVAPWVHVARAAPEAENLDRPVFLRVQAE